MLLNVSHVLRIVGEWLDLKETQVHFSTPRKAIFFFFECMCEMTASLFTTPELVELLV